MLPLHRYYYLHNFERVLAWVREGYGDLLGGIEHAFLAQFEQLPQQSRALLVRLLLRRATSLAQQVSPYASYQDHPLSAICSNC